MAPIAMSRAEWSRIQKWTSSEEDPLTVQRREYVRYLDATSREMTKSWPNSVENVNKRNDELRRARVEAAEQANNIFYKKYMKRKRDQQQRLMHSARDTIFKNKDAPKLLLGAVIETVIQKERIEQIKFDNERKKEQEIKKMKEDQEIIQKAKEWHELQAQKKNMLFAANKNYQKELLDQAHEVAERKRLEYETELQMQQEDNLKAAQQIDEIKLFEKNFKAAEKARIWSDMQRAQEEVDARRRETQARDGVDNRLIGVLNKSRARVEAMRKQTERQAQEERQRTIDNIGNKLVSGDEARAAREQAALDKALNEKEAVYKARTEADRQKLERFKQQRIASRKQFLEEEEHRLHRMQTMRQWELINRFKNQEIFKEYEKQIRDEKDRKVQEYRAEILRLWHERDEREQRERAERRYFYGELAEKKLRDADNQLLSHAAHLIAEARSHGRPEHALFKAIDRYCKMYRLYPMPDLPASMQEHFKRYGPKDLSKPDPQYQPPPPLSPDPGPELPDDDSETRRDGLQPDVPKIQPKPKKADDTKEDFKRQGKANGLQRRRDAVGEITLPPITVLPCVNPECKCKLKQK